MNNFKLIPVLFFILSFFVLVKPSYAQQCAQIVNVTSNVTQIESAKIFTCTVTVDAASANSPTIGCGISFDGSWPLNFCPSDQAFGGWNGNSATFNCVIPNTNIKAKTVELVGHDFKQGCTPQAGKKTTLTIKQPVDQSKEVDPNDQIGMVRELLNLIVGNGNGSGSNDPTPTTDPVKDLTDPNNPGVCTGVSNGSTTSTSNFSANASFVYYCQGNTSWKSNCSLGDSGCGPTSLAMVLSSFGVRMTPPQVDAVFQQNGWRTCGGGSNMQNGALKSSWFANLGFTVGPNLASGPSFNVTQVKKFIDEGYLIVASSQFYPCAGCVQPGIPINHIIVIDGMDINAGTIHVRDPNNCSYADGNDEKSTNQIKKVTSISWLYAYPVKKIR